MVSRMCAGLVALYEFEEDADYARMSETGGSSLLEPAGVNVSRYDNGTLTTGTFDVVMTQGQYLYIPRTASLGGEFTVNVWVEFASDPATGDLVLATRDTNGTNANGIGGKVYWITTSGDVRPNFKVLQNVTDTGTNVQWSADVSNGAWHLLSFGEYPSPTTSEPYQWTIWISVDAGTRVTATITWPPKVFIGDLRLTAASVTTNYDQLSVYSRTLSAADLTWLYNSRAGRPYPFTENPF